MQYKKWTIKFISMLIISVVLILTFLYFSKIIMFSYADRIPNIRKINKEYRLNLIQEYINFKFKKGVEYDIIIGDSQFYGFKQYEEDTFAYLLKKELTEYHIINLSIVDATEKDIIQILNILKEKDIKIKHIIYNFNLSHFSTIVQEDKLPKNKSNILTNLYTLKLQEDYWISYFKQKKFHKKNSQKYDSRKYNKDRYNIIDKNNINLNQLLSIMKSISKDVLVVFSPHSIDSLKESNYHIDDFIKNIERYKSIVRTKDCFLLDLTLAFEKKDFLDILHLSVDGHKKITQKIKNHIDIRNK